MTRTTSTPLRGLVDPETLAVSEVGDGNLNLVFRCADAAGRRLVLKQALPYVRLVGPDWPMTEQRATREANAIRAHSAVSEDVCRLIDFDGLPLSAGEGIMIPASKVHGAVAGADGVTCVEAFGD